MNRKKYLVAKPARGLALKTLPLTALGLVGAAGLAYAATFVAQIQLDPEITLSEGGNGHKPKLMRAADGTLVSVFGDSPSGAGNIYDPKADVERPARDLFVKWCKPTLDSDTTTPSDQRITCNKPAEWKKATTAFGTAGNISGSALMSSVSTAWQGGDPALDRMPFYGNTDKPNIKQSGPAMVLTWIGAYCPDGDLRTAEVQPSAQRAIRYIERDSRVVAFHCTWAAYSTNNGRAWSAPIQLSNGERDAKQDVSNGSYDSTTATARINFTWQEDPEGLQLGEGDGPGEGASGAKVTGGTDVWYTHATLNTTTSAITLAPASTGLGTDRALGYRISDNWELEQKFGLPGQITNVFDTSGAPLDGRAVESGNAGASRANTGMVGTTAVVAWEETKGAGGLDEGKFIRYQSFPYNQPPALLADKGGCLISNPHRSAKRVRFLTQSSAEATGVAAPDVPGRSGVNLAIFWREGLTDKGGPADIVARRGMIDPAAPSNLQSGLNPARMVPAVDANCRTSIFEETQLLNNAAGQNLSSRTLALTATDDGLDDDTELDNVENSLAHRGVLRGDELWVGYEYTADLVKMWAQIDNYNFWLRKFTYDPVTGGTWNLPINVSNIDDKSINVREPRIFGTPPSNRNPGFCENNAPSTATDPAFCQDRSVIYLMWGTQTNVSPFDPDGADDLGVFGTVSQDGGATFIPAVPISEEMGTVFDDDDSAFETQPQTRPDGKRFYVVFNTANATMGTSAGNYVSGSVAQVEVCMGDHTIGDSDADRVCDDLDQCLGDDAVGDTDADGVCDDRDLCDGDDALGDLDGDGVCGTPPPGTEGDGGCGCRSTSGSSGLVLIAGALLLLRRPRSRKPRANASAR
jgi:MYXO-CTERM domain-containing protein